MDATARRRTAPPGVAWGVLEGADGTPLRTATWARDGAPSAVLLGGRGEFIEKHFETVADLLDRGFQVQCMDWRGQGLSGRALADRRKGHVADFALFEDDLARFLETIVPAGPRILMGHSMGGHVVLRLLARRPGLATRAVVVAPMLAIDFGALSLRSATALARTACMLGLSASYAPGGKAADPLLMEFEGNTLTSDPERFADMHVAIRANPDLAIGGPTWGWIRAAIESMAMLADRSSAEAIATPTLLVVADADRIVVPAAIRAFASAMPAAELLDIAGSRHEVLKERDVFRGRFWQAFDAFAAGLPRG